MGTNKHGGSRPKQRDDDTRGGPREGAGRKPEIGKLRKGQWIVVERQTLGGEIHEPQMWQVVAIGGDDGTLIEFQSGDDIITFSPPDDEG